jgi:hypothetical protein
MGVCDVIEELQDSTPPPGQTVGGYFRRWDSDYPHLLKRFEIDY